MAVREEARRLVDEVPDDRLTDAVDLLRQWASPEPGNVPRRQITEIGYMLRSRAGSRAEAGFLRDIADGLTSWSRSRPLTVARAADRVEEYSDLSLGTADSIVIAVAERFRAVSIATLDRRHFSVMRPAHTTTFTLLP